MIGSQPVRLCPRCGFELVLDTVIARTSIDAGWPAVELWRCRMGHSVREWPTEIPRPRWRDGIHPCAVCGRPLPKAKGCDGSGSRKAHLGACQAVVQRERAKWNWHHPLNPFVLEQASWYRGPLRVMAPLPPLDPLAGRIPRDWAEGWGRLHGVDLAAPAA